MNQTLQPILKVSNLSKHFSLTSKEKKKRRIKESQIIALNDLSFELQRGEILGLIGGNGAGKTTTLRMLSTAIEPSHGVITINGRPDPHYIRTKIGFLSNTTGLHPKLTAREVITLYGELHGLSKPVIVERIKTIGKNLNFEKFLDTYCEKLSFGTKQKVSIARAMIHEPEMIIMDEPTTGLDVFACAEVMDSIQELKNEQKSVIFSSHNMEDIQQVCDRILVLHAGKDIFQGKIENLVAKMQCHTLRDAVHKLLEDKQVD